MPNNIKKESNVPSPTADNSRRLGKDGGGNTPVMGERHGAEKAEKIPASDRYTLRKGGEMQPTRQGGGNTSVTGESHGQAKAERISEADRY